MLMIQPTSSKCSVNSLSSPTVWLTWLWNCSSLARSLEIPPRCLYLPGPLSCRCDVAEATSSRNVAKNLHLPSSSAMVQVWNREKNALLDLGLCGTLIRTSIQWRNGLYSFWQLIKFIALNSVCKPWICKFDLAAMLLQMQSNVKIAGKSYPATLETQLHIKCLRKTVACELWNNLRT